MCTAQGNLWLVTPQRLCEGPGVWKAWALHPPGLVQEPGAATISESTATASQPPEPPVGTGPVSLLGAAKHTQARLWVWLPSGKCFPDAEAQLGVSARRNVCVSRRGLLPRPRRLQLPPRAGRPPGPFARMGGLAWGDKGPMPPFLLSAGPVPQKAQFQDCGAEVPSPGPVGAGKVGQGLAGCCCVESVPHVLLMGTSLTPRDNSDPQSRHWARAVNSSRGQWCPGGLGCPILWAQSREDEGGWAGSAGHLGALGSAPPAPGS